MNKKSKPADANQTSRRDFIRTSSLLVAGGAVTGSLSIARSAHARGSDLIKVGLVGCGKRGRAAAVEALNTTSGPVKLVAMGDAFPDKLQSSFRHIKGALSKEYADRLDVPNERRFIGLDAYQRVLETDIDLVVLTTPPGFRPLHFEAAVEADKHVFMEKPVAVDAPGIRRVQVVNAEARQKNLAVAVGLHRRHEVAYQETIGHLQDGIVGDVTTLRVYWNSDGVREPSPRQKRQSELEYQMRNWYYYDWLCGDHIVEQHVHNLDVGNWLIDALPVTVNAQGGREVRDGEGYGQIFDHFFCEFAFENNIRMFSQCRHIKNGWRSVSEHVHCTKGYADITGGKIYDPSGEMIWRTQGRRDGHQQEQHDLFSALRAGEIPNEGDYGANSTMTAIFGRLAAYSGKQIAWKDAIESDRSLANVDALATLNDTAPVLPENGRYPVAVPGVTKTI